MKRILFILCSMFLVLQLSSCYYQHHRTDAWDADDTVSSTFDFVEKHHYSVGYNFVVQKNMLSLCTEIPSRAQQLSIMPDSVYVRKGDDIIVADIAIVQEDESDSVWVKVARDQETQGWVRESTLLPSVSPDDPISNAIYVFSGNHVWGTFLLVGIVLFTLFVQMWWRYVHQQRKDSRFWAHVLVPLNFSICSIYPTLLRIALSGAAVFYASIQLFAPHVWADFYFDPTLNPFAVPPLLGAFLFSAWLILLFVFATVDDTFRQLSFGKSMLYLLYTITVLAILYLFFSLTTLVYVGYPFYFLFCVFSIYRYITKLRPRYRCGRCGMPIHDKGICPRCHTKNL